MGKVETIELPSLLFFCDFCIINHKRASPSAARFVSQTYCPVFEKIGGAADE